MCIVEWEAQGRLGGVLEGVQMAGWEGHMSRSAVYLIHKVRAGAMQRIGGGFSCGVKNLRNRMLSQGECERPVIRGTSRKLFVA
jgi:hypothetical protein